MLELQWNVATILERWSRAGSLASPAREDLAMLVWRNRNRVFYRAIDEPEREQLAMLSEGTTFAEICDAIANNVDEGDAAAAINQRLEIWLRDGILVRQLRADHDASGFASDHPRRLEIVRGNNRG